MILMAKEREVICRAVVEIFKAWGRAYYGSDQIGDRCTALVIGATVMIGQACDQPLTASSIADYTGIPRGTVRLDDQHQATGTLWRGSESVAAAFFPAATLRSSAAILASVSTSCPRPALVAVW